MRMTERLFTKIAGTLTQRASGNAQASCDRECSGPGTDMRRNAHLAWNTVIRLHNDNADRHGRLAMRNEVAICARIVVE